MKMENIHQVAADELQTQHVITSLCDTYYSKLKNAANLASYSFEDRVSIAHELVSDAKAHGLYFYRRSADPPGQNAASTQHRPAINLASNDYVGFTRHPAVKAAGIAAINTYGGGSGSVPMLAGTTVLHKQLEEDLAAFTGYAASLTYSSCFAANFGVLTALLTMADVAILDIYVHGSIIDGCCRTNIIYFSHNDPVSLQLAFQKAKHYNNILVVVDGVYSMDGDLALLKEIQAVTKENGAWLMVDESHAIGVVGENGRGTHSYYGITEKSEMLSGSLGKALGGVGGFVAGSAELISLLELTSRPFLFSTSLPQNIAAQLIAAIQLLQSEPALLGKLWHNVALFSTGLQQMGFPVNSSLSAIIPIIIPDEVKLIQFCHNLHNEGVFVNPVFFPIVPRRKSRIRMSVTASLQQDQLEYALEKIESSGKELDLL